MSEPLYRLEMAKAPIRCPQRRLEATAARGAPRWPAPQEILGITVPVDF
jgi:hypothetical protein